MSVRIYGNRAIKTLPGEATRPTSARVREALFNIWQSRVLGARWLDLCAGSGAIGAEALCRGAAEVVGIEKSSAACQVVTENWQKVAKPKQKFQVLRGDVVRQLTQLKMPKIAENERFDCVYFDPPYASGLYAPVLAQLVDLLSDRAQIAVEYSPAYWQPSQLSPEWTIVKEKRYGSTHLVFLSCRAE